jgi:hypothetical protein
MYTVTLADGTKLTNLSVNGTNFVSKKKIDESIFTDNLSTITVSDGKTENTYNDIIFIQQMELDGKYYIAFREKFAEEKLLETIAANESTVTDIEVALAEIYEMMLGGN